MSNWRELKVRMVKLSDIEEREKLEDLDLREDNLPDVPEMFKPVRIDLDKTMAYQPLYSSEGEASQDRCELTYINGGFIIVEIAYEDLKKLYK